MVVLGCETNLGVEFQGLGAWRLGGGFRGLGVEGLRGLGVSGLGLRAWGSESRAQGRRFVETALPECASSISKLLASCKKYRASFRGFGQSRRGLWRGVDVGPKSRVLWGRGS